MPKNKVALALGFATVFFIALAIYFLTFNPSHNLTLFIIFWIVALASLSGYSYIGKRAKRMSKPQALVKTKVTSGLFQSISAHVS